MVAPQLEPRLKAVTSFIAGEVLLDIGSDHALVPRYVLESGRVKRVIAVEKTLAPFERSKRALRGYEAEVRLGDGLSIVDSGEADVLSVSGMGAQTILKILNAHPKRLPPRLVLQANDDPEKLRVWAYQHGYCLKDEAIAAGFWRYVVVSLEQATLPDPAYDVWQDQLQLAMRYGPHLLTKRHPLLREELLHQHTVYTRLARQGAPASADLVMIEQALTYYA